MITEKKSDAKKSKMHSKIDLVYLSSRGAAETPVVITIIT